MEITTDDQVMIMAIRRQIRIHETDLATLNEQLAVDYDYYPHKGEITLLINGRWVSRHVLYGELLQHYRNLNKMLNNVEG